MLTADPLIVWFLALYLVVVTRDFAAALFEVGFLLGIIVLVAEGTTGTPSVVFDFAVRRPAYALYGAAAGYALAAAFKSRVLIPVHSFSNTSVHLPGPLSLVAVAYATYALIMATGLSNLSSGAPPIASATEIGLWSATFVALAVAFIAILWSSIVDANNAFAFRYRDSGSREHPLLPPSRLAAEVVLLSILVFAPNAFWIYFPLPGIAWPQWAAGLLAIPLTLGAFVFFYFALRDRHAMDRVHLDGAHSRVSWGSFVAILGIIYAIASIVWISVAHVANSPFQAEMTILGLTGGVILAALAIVVAPGYVWRNDSSTYRPSATQPVTEQASEEEISRRRLELEGTIVVTERV